METKKENEFDTVKFFREVKEKIAKETEGMSFADFKKYISERKLRVARQKPTHNRGLAL